MDRRQFMGAALGAGGLLAASGARGEEPADLTGRWEGHVDLANGHRLRVEVRLQAAGGEPGWSGTWTAAVIDEEGPGTPEEGRATARRVGDGFEVQAIKQGQTWTLRARTASAGSHAELAFLGTVEMNGAAGVAILWRYKS